MKFSDVFIKSLKPQEKKYYRREANGFTIRVMPSGAKTWLFVYTFEGKRREMNLGGYPEVKLADARTKYTAAYELLKNSKNPAEIDRQAQEERRKSPTVADLAKEYIEKHAMKFKRSWKEDERLLNVEILPQWGKRKASDITKRDATLLLEKIVDRGSPAMSNQVLKIARKMFNFAVERDIIPHTPFVGVKALAPNNRRERTLSEAEIRTLWHSIDHAAISGDIKRALKLVLVTGQRPGEVCGMRSSEINGRWWTIPAGRAKNGREHRVYLTDTALELIGDLTVTNEESGDTTAKGYIFPCPHKDKEQPIDSHALPVAVRRNLAWPLTDKNGKRAYENRLGIDQFTPHDLRRTAATFLAGMGFMDEVIDAVLNHVKQGIIRTYNRHDYDNEKKAALESWETKLWRILTDGEEADMVPRGTMARRGA